MYFNSKKKDMYEMVVPAFEARHICGNKGKVSPNIVYTQYSAFQHHHDQDNNKSGKLRIEHPHMFLDVPLILLIRYNDQRNSYSVLKFLFPTHSDMSRLFNRSMIMDSGFFPQNNNLDLCAMFLS